MHGAFPSRPDRFDTVHTGTETGALCPLHPHIPRIHGRNTNVSLSITSSQVTVLVFPNFRGERSTAYWAYHHVLRNLQKVTADQGSTDEGTDPTEDPVSVTCRVPAQIPCSSSSGSLNYTLSHPNHLGSPINPRLEACNLSTDILAPIYSLFPRGRVLARDQPTRTDPGIGTVS